MHTTLSVRSNLIMLGLYAIILATVLVESPPPVAAVLIPFPVIGLAAGYTQFRAVKRRAHAFIEARTLAQVRAALKSSGYGRASMLLSIFNPFVMLGMALLINDAFALSTVILAQTLFAFVRELLSLPALVALRRMG